MEKNFEIRISDGINNAATIKSYADLETAIKSYNEIIKTVEQEYELHPGYPDEAPKFFLEIWVCEGDWHIPLNIMSENYIGDIDYVYNQLKYKD